MNKSKTACTRVLNFSIYKADKVRKLVGTSDPAGPTAEETPQVFASIDELFMANSSKPRRGSAGSQRSNASTRSRGVSLVTINCR